VEQAAALSPDTSVASEPVAHQHVCHGDLVHGCGVGGQLLRVKAGQVNLYSREGGRGGSVGGMSVCVHSPPGTGGMLACPACVRLMLRTH
jgi:hypothetical protein